MRHTPYFRKTQEARESLVALRDSAICSSSRSTGETNREDVTDRQSSLSKALRGTKLQVSHLSHLTHHINNEQRTTEGRRRRRCMGGRTGGKPGRKKKRSYFQKRETPAAVDPDGRPLEDLDGDDCLGDYDSDLAAAYLPPCVWHPPRPPAGGLVGGLVSFKPTVSSTSTRVGPTRTTENHHPVGRTSSSVAVYTNRPLLGRPPAAKSRTNTNCRGSRRTASIRIRIFRRNV